MTEQQKDRYLDNVKLINELLKGVLNKDGDINFSGTTENDFIKRLFSYCNVKVVPMKFKDSDFNGYIKAKANRCKICVDSKLSDKEQRYIAVHLFSHCTCEMMVNKEELYNDYYRYEFSDLKQYYADCRQEVLDDFKSDIAPISAKTLKACEGLSKETCDKIKAAALESCKPYELKCKEQLQKLYSAEEEERAMEDDANALAREILMPHEVVKTCVASGKEVSAASFTAKFFVTEKVATARLNDFYSIEKNVKAKNASKEMAL